MPALMLDSPLNRAEQALQQPFRKHWYFNGLLAGLVVLLAFLPIHSLPDRRQRPAADVPLTYQPVGLAPAQGPLRLAGAWVLNAADPRFAGLSALAIDGAGFIAVSDLGAVIRFDRPTAMQPKALLQNLSVGPGPFGKKWSRDAESLALDPLGRGWWIGYEQHHSLWLYDAQFRRAMAAVELRKTGWRDNHGAEGLLADRNGLLVTAENGRDAIEVQPGRIRQADLEVDAEVADAARAPDESAWLLLRSKEANGISQWVAPLLKGRGGYRAGPRWPLPKAPFDNYEGMAIERLQDGRWRFWLVTDDGHRVMARTLLVALDYAPPMHGKSPATSAGPSKKLLAQSP